PGAIPPAGGRESAPSPLQSVYRHSEWPAGLAPGGHASPAKTRSPGPIARPRELAGRPGRLRRWGGHSLGARIVAATADHARPANWPRPYTSCTPEVA